MQRRALKYGGVRSEPDDTRFATVQRAFEGPLIVAAVLTVPATILEFSSVSPSLHALATTLNWLIWGAFLAELLVMLAITPRRA